MPILSIKPVSMEYFFAELYWLNDLGCFSNLKSIFLAHNWFKISYTLAPIPLIKVSTNPTTLSTTLS